MSEKERRWGQFYTAAEVADLVLGFCLRRPTDLLLDPSCGEGVFLLRAARYRRWLSDSGEIAGRGTLWGVEIDAEAAGTAGAMLAEQGGYAHLLTEDFFTLGPGQASAELDGRPTKLPQAFDCIVGNPPYTRSEWLTEVMGDPGYRDHVRERVTDGLGERMGLNQRAGLYAYFILHGFRFLRPGGRFGLVAPNSWLDVDYGRGLKEFLLDRFRIVAIIESAVETWFERARVNTCLVILERCDDRGGRMQNRVRLARLWRPLADLISAPEDSPQRAVEVENLVTRLLPGHSRQSADLSVRVVSQATLDATEKWGPLLRAPDVYFAAQRAPRTRSLGEVVDISRGLTTGANAFFYPSRGDLARWQIEDRFLRPLLKSPKQQVERLCVRPDDLEGRALMVNHQQGAAAGTRLADYVRWGEAQGIHQRPTCARRSPWYALPHQPTAGARLAWPKGVWNRHFVLLVEGNVVIDQQFYVLVAPPGRLTVLAALLNSTWVALQAELAGRCNFGEGVLWLAGYEVSQIRIPDPESLSPSSVQQLEGSFARLAAEPVVSLEKGVARPAQQALDELVFDLVGLSRAEQRMAVEAAVQLVGGRAKRAESG
jgi:methylase of polypeptide subunit release factors